MKKSYKISLPDDISFDVTFQEDNEVDSKKVKQFVDSLKRPKWYEDKKNRSHKKDTRGYMMENPTSFDSDMKKSTDPFTQQARSEWLCSLCKCGTTYGGVDIGHKVDWRTELISAGVLSKAEARAVYNNLLNLRIECATCNRSHDWEGSSDNEDD